MGPTARLLFDRRFWPMFWTQLASAVDDHLVQGALAVWVVQQGWGGPGVVSMLALFIAPAVVVSGFAGQLADGVDQARVVRWTRWAELALMGCAAVGLWLGQPMVVAGVLVLLGVKSAVFGPVKYAILPRILDGEDLVGGNALVALGTHVGLVAGLVGGGLLAWHAGPGAVGLVGMAVACGGLACGVQIGPVPAPDEVRGWHPVRATWEVLGDAAASRPIFLAIAGISWFWGVVVVVLAVVPQLAETGPWDGPGLAGTWLVAFAGGAAIGSLLCARLSGQRLELGLVPLGALGMSLACLDLWLGSRVLAASATGAAVWRTGADLAVLAGSGALYVVPLITLIQERPDPARRGRTLGGNNVLNAVGMLAACAGVAAAWAGDLGPAGVFGLLGLLNVVAAAVIFGQVREFGFRLVVWVLANVMYRVRVLGQGNLPRTGGCLVVANHVSFVDWLLLGGAIRRPVHFVMDVDFAGLPGMRWLARNELVIPIASPKRDEVAYEQAFVSVRRKLREGWVVGIFPEGRITSDGRLSPFRPGVERIVERDPVPVVPVAIHGMWGSWFSRRHGSAMHGRPRRFWSRVAVTIGPPVPPAEATAERLQRAVEELIAAAEVP